MEGRLMQHHPVQRRLTGRRALLIFLAICSFCPAAAIAQATSDTLSVEQVKPASHLATVWEFLGDLFGLSSGNLEEKLLRIAVILLIVIIAKVFLGTLQLVSRWMVYARWGPFKYIFHNHQRSITIQALLISLAKYVVYIIALGYVLREIGIDYKTYLASLSLVGIAIGFGSQGLVQDVVTGFFILFEDQFSVGDMVEISGQVGIVEAIGLRTTRIRNYFGASVVLQNRNIPMAIEYPAGAFQAFIDVAITGPDTASDASVLLQHIGTQMEKQFHGVIRRPPTVEGLVELTDTGEWFVRLQVDIWPAQQWVIDTQMVPRIREIFKRQAVEIPGDRVVAFYHLPPDKVVLPGIVHAIRRASEITGWDFDGSTE